MHTLICLPLRNCSPPPSPPKYTLRFSLQTVWGIKMVFTADPFAIQFLALKTSNKDFCGASTTWMRCLQWISCFTLPWLHLGGALKHSFDWSNQNKDLYVGLWSANSSKIAADCTSPCQPIKFDNISSWVCKRWILRSNYDVAKYLI